jgi:hypothetical protein
MFGKVFFNGCKGCNGGSSATDYVTNLTDLIDVRKHEKGISKSA